MFRTRYYTPTANINSVAKPDARGVPRPEPYVASLYEYQKLLKAARPNVQVTRLTGGQGDGTPQPVTMGGVAEPSPIYGSASKVELFQNGRKVGQTNAAHGVFELAWTPDSSDISSDRLLVRAHYGQAVFVDRHVVGHSLGQE
jgi:hypothetical protein